MELTPQILIVVLPLIFLGGFVDSVAGGGGLITLPAYLMAGIPAHLAMGTNKVVNGTGTALASFKYFRGGKVLLRPAIISGIGALLGAAIGTKIALLINEDILKIMMLVALPCAAILLMLKKDFGKESDAPAREYTPQQEMTRAALIGLGLGCYDGLIGPGTGTFMIMALRWHFRWTSSRRRAARRSQTSAPMSPRRCCSSSAARSGGCWHFPRRPAICSAPTAARATP